MQTKLHHHTSHPFVVLAALVSAVTLGVAGWSFPAQAANPVYTSPGGVTFRYPTGWTVQAGKKAFTLVPNAATKNTLVAKKVVYGLTVADLTTNGTMTSGLVSTLESGWTSFVAAYSTSQAKLNGAKAVITSFNRSGWSSALVTLTKGSGSTKTTWKIYLVSKNRKQVYAVTEKWVGAMSLPITAVGPAVATSIAGVVPAYVDWSFTGSAWSARTTPPPCPSPLRVPLPVDISQATSILYPGQYRGGNYKPHGGFRFDTLTTGAITVRAPFDGYVVSGVRYTELGETQYLFDIYSPCGLRVRFDHLYTLSTAFATIASTLPAPNESTMTTKLAKPVKVRAGDIVATIIGHPATTNFAFDFGVYDLRKRNSAAADPAWLATHANELEMGAYALCWLDQLSAAETTAVNQLPAADQTSGAQSDYCR